MCIIGIDIRLIGISIFLYTNYFDTVLINDVLLVIIVILPLIFYT